MTCVAPQGSRLRLAPTHAASAAGADVKNRRAEVPTAAARDEHHENHRSDRDGDHLLDKREPARSKLVLAGRQAHEGSAGRAHASAARQVEPDLLPRQAAGGSDIQRYVADAGSARRIEDPK